MSNLCKIYSQTNFLNDSVWIYSSEVIEKLPITEKEIQKLFSAKNKIYSFTDDRFSYVLFIKDYKIKGEKSPLSFMFNNIRELLRNKNKISFLNNIEDQLYKEAVSSEDIKIY